MIVFRKIEAGALQFVLFIGAVIAVLLMSFLVLTYTYQHFDKKTDVLIEVLRSSQYGMEASLKEDFLLQNDYTIVKESNIEISMIVKRDFWGGFEKRTIKTRHYNTSFTKTAFIGGQDDKELPALYINNHMRPVVLAGNSKITGTAYLPEQGLKIGNIDGNSYHRSQLLYGEERKSDSTLPNLSKELEGQIKLLTNKRYIPDGEMLTNVSAKDLSNSFEEETKIYKDRHVRLKNINLTGNIVIVADYKIIVEASAKLMDVLLIAPDIEIQNNVNGAFQAIATESIHVGKKCQLAYPTALIVNKLPTSMYTKNSESNTFYSQSPEIFLDAYTCVRGYIMVLDNNTKYAPQIKIERKAKVIGEVYCSKNLELKGTVHGMVTANGFVAFENGSIYQNHLYDGKINSLSISDQYTGILLASRETNKKVMKWLY